MSKRIMNEVMCLAEDLGLNIYYQDTDSMHINYEEVEILLNERGKCYVDTSDNIPKTIDNCNYNIGDIVTVKYGEGLAYAQIVNP